MPSISRRRFLSDVGRGMIVASVGSSLAADLGVTPAWAEEEGTLTFGDLEPLVDLLQGTPPEKMLPAVAEKIRKGTSLRDLVSAAGLANARAFGGEDYVGFHTLMALGPALGLTEQMGSSRAALPVLKVLFRNSSRLQEIGGAEAHALRPVTPSALPTGVDEAEHLRRLVHEQNRDSAESMFAALVERSPQEALNDLLVTVEDATEVHRVVLVHRAWDMVSLVGSERAHTMLRQSLRFCLKNETVYARNFSHVRELLPKVLEQHRLIGRRPGERAMSDAELASMVELLFLSTADQAADAVAGALAEGFSPSSLAEAISLAANQLVLRDAGRSKREVQPGKPEGSVHGDSIGVHACDSANAWRNIARYGDTRHAIAATVLAGYQVAQDRVQRGGDFANWKPRPAPELVEQVNGENQAGLLSALNEAIRANEQELACAITQRYLDRQHAPAELFSTFAKFATSEDGALHAEKYYRTVQEEFAATRPAFRNRQLVALARVTASEFGATAPGYSQACELLGVDA
jgi:hypothetical protein